MATIFPNHPFAIPKGLARNDWSGCRTRSKAQSGVRIEATGHVERRSRTAIHSGQRPCGDTSLPVLTFIRWGVKALMT